MAVHDTEENGRTKLTDRTIESLLKTVDFEKHRLFISDNGSCEATQEIYVRLAQFWILYKFPFDNLKVIKNGENIGTAKAINKCWKFRKPGEHCIKMDNDVVIHYKGWVEEMEEAIRIEPMLGQVGLKRKDCWEYPEHENPEIRSKLIMLPHAAGERWIVVEQAKHIIGTCVMHNSELLDKVGYLFQPTLYGHDDVLMSWRSYLAGFISVFIPWINIDHIDPGGTEYQKWKEEEGGRNGHLVSNIVDEYISGKKSLYHED